MTLTTLSSVLKENKTALKKKVLEALKIDLKKFFEIIKIDGFMWFQNPSYYNDEDYSKRFEYFLIKKNGIENIEELNERNDYWGAHAKDWIVYDPYYNRNFDEYDSIPGTILSPEEKKIINEFIDTIKDYQEILCDIFGEGYVMILNEKELQIFIENRGDY